MNLKVGITYSEQEARTKLNSVLNKLEYKSKVQIPIEIDGERFVKTVRTYQDAMKNLVEETVLYNGAGKAMSSTITNITTAEERVNKAITEQVNKTKQLKSAQQSLNVSTKKSVSLFQDFTATFMKMAKFNTINLIYDAIINSMSEMVEVTEKLNAATVEFQKVSDLSGESLQAYKEHLGELGAEVGRTMSEMIEGSTTFRKSGFTDEESAQLAKINAMFQNIADEELSASDAAQILISTMKGFNLTANEVEHVADVINEVSNNFAVSSSDISSGLANVSAVAKMAGNSIEETTGMLTAMVEISQSAGKSSRGLNIV
jgi:polyhydroxyalkanoate synthesis regulator phasin